MSTKIRKALFISFLLCNGGFAFAQKWYTSDVDKKVDEILNQMTIQEKLSFTQNRSNDWGYRQLGCLMVLKE